MRSVNNIIGQRFGKLTVVSYAGDSYWHCKCDCGNYKDVRGTYLRKGVIRSCGCYMKEKAANKDKQGTKLYPAKTNLIDKRFGSLRVIADTGKRTDQGKLWLCKCDCGNTKEVSDFHLRYNMTHSCGCRKSQNLIGQKFGHLTVIEKTDKRYHGYVVWKCKCDCGNIKEVSSHNLAYNKGITSCGCMNSQRTKENMSKHNIYKFAGKNCVCYTEDMKFKFFFDKEDYDKLKEYYWTNHAKAGDYYVTAFNKGSKKNSCIIAWRFVLNEYDPKKKVIYKNGNKFDLRKENLEIKQ